MSFPRTDPELSIWLKNFTQALASHAATLGLTPADVASAQADASMFDYLIGDLLPAFQSAMQARTAYKNLIRNGPVGSPGGDPPSAPANPAPPATVAPGIVPRLRKLIQRIKAAPNYTEAIGQDLDIIGTETNAPDDIANAKPTAKGFPQPGSQVRIEFNKGNFDGVLVEGRRKGDADWTALGQDLYSPFIDTRAPAQPGTPEVREYRLRFILRDEAVGEWSDIIAVVTTP